MEAVRRCEGSASSSHLGDGLLGEEEVALARRAVRREAVHARLRPLVGPPRVRRLVAALRGCVSYTVSQRCAAVGALAG